MNAFQMLRRAIAKLLASDCIRPRFAYSFERLLRKAAECGWSRNSFSRIRSSDAIAFCVPATEFRLGDSLARHLQMFKDMVVVENVFRVVNEMDDDELDRRLAELERAFGQATTLDPAAGEGSGSIH